MAKDEREKGEIQSQSCLCLHEEQSGQLHGKDSQPLLQKTLHTFPNRFLESDDAEEVEGKDYYSLSEIANVNRRVRDFSQVEFKNTLSLAHVWKRYKNTSINPPRTEKCFIYEIRSIAGCLFFFFFLVISERSERSDSCFFLQRR